MRLVIPAAVVMLIGAVLLIRRVRHENRMEEALVIRLRNTALYGHIYPLLCKHDGEQLEQLDIRTEGLAFHLLEPYGHTERYTFRKHGLDEPSDETLWALSQAAMVDMKVLRDRRRYAFRMRRARMSDGRKRVWYEYRLRRRLRKKALRRDSGPIRRYG